MVHHGPPCRQKRGEVCTRLILAPMPRWGWRLEGFRHDLLPKTNASFCDVSPASLPTSPPLFWKSEAGHGPQQQAWQAPKEALMHTSAFKRQREENKQGGFNHKSSCIAQVVLGSAVNERWARLANQGDAFMLWRAGHGHAHQENLFTHPAEFLLP